VSSSIFPSLSRSALSLSHYVSFSLSLSLSLPPYYIFNSVSLLLSLFLSPTLSHSLSRTDTRLLSICSMLCTCVFGVLLSAHKYMYVNHLKHTDRNVLYMDVDVVLQADPFASLPAGFDIWTSMDHSFVHCTGIMALRSTARYSVDSSTPNINKKAHTFTHTCTRNTNTHTYTNTHIYTCTHHICTHAHMHTHKHGHTHTNSHALTHKHT